MQLPMKPRRDAEAEHALPPSGAVSSGPGQRVFEHVQSDLMLGGYRPGEWLRLVDLEERYQASRFEIRAALARLAAIELLEHLPNRGYRVAVIDEAEARHHVELRLMLEVPAAGLVLRHATKRDVAQLRRLAAAFADRVENGATAEIERANHAFHRGFFALCGNPRLERMINEARERGRPNGWLHWKTVAANRASAADHVAMVDAVAARDDATLRRIAFRHPLWMGAPRDGLAALLGVAEA